MKEIMEEITGRERKLSNILTSENIWSREDKRKIMLRRKE